MAMTLKMRHMQNLNYYLDTVARTSVTNTVARTSATDTVARISAETVARTSATNTVARTSLLVPLNTQ